VTSYVVVVPGVPALLPAYRGRIDPVPELRDACHDAVAWLVERSPSRIAVHADSAAGSRAQDVATALLAEVGFGGDVVPGSAAEVSEGRLIVANGSARRGEKAPGHLDPRSFGFDEQIEAALAKGDAASLGGIELDLGADLLAEGLSALRSLASLAQTHVEPRMLYADDPFGIRYWVVTWKCVF
jgi:hypothetical protein